MTHCPLCGGEYRRDVNVCPTCDANLVDSPAESTDKDNSAVLLWISKDLVEFDWVAAALRDAQIPVHAERGLGGLVGTLLNSLSKIYVLQSDFGRALDVAAHASDEQTRTKKDTQGCYACGAECSAALTSCPKCRAVLIVAGQEGSTRGSPKAVASKALKYCPLCDVEYREDHDRCTVCNVALVPEELRGRPLNEKGRHERIVLVWKAGDPIAVSQGIAALRDAAIPHHVKATNDHFVFELGIPRPKYEVRVFESDAEAARALLAGISETVPFGLSEPEPRLPAEPAEAAPHRRTSAEGKPSQATAEIWSGEDAGLAHILEDCLRENHIAVRSEGHEPGTMRIFVPPADAVPAREILREIREGTPLT